jgi:hypothetical protein
MRKTTPVFGHNRKPAYSCAIELKSQTDLQLKYPEGNRQPLFFVSLCNKFPVTEEKSPSETGFAGLRPPPGSRREPSWVPGARNPSTI